MVSMRTEGRLSTTKTGAQFCLGRLNQLPKDVSVTVPVAGDFPAANFDLHICGRLQNPAVKSQVPQPQGTVPTKPVIAKDFVQGEPFLGSKRGGLLDQ